MNLAYVADLNAVLDIPNYHKTTWLKCKLDPVSQIKRVSL